MTTKQMQKSTNAVIAPISKTSITFFQEFMVYADRLMRLLAEEALCRLPSIAEDGEVETPVGTAREGTKNGKETEERGHNRGMAANGCQVSYHRCSEIQNAGSSVLPKLQHNHLTMQIVGKCLNN